MDYYNFIRCFDNSSPSTPGFSACCCGVNLHSSSFGKNSGLKSSSQVTLLNPFLRYLLPKSVLGFLFSSFVPIIYKRYVAELFHLPVSQIVVCLVVLACHYVSYASLHVLVNFLQSLVGCYGWEIPSRPVHLVRIVCVVELAVEGFYKTLGCHRPCLAFCLFPS